jgi:hypothetical protein
LKCDNFFWKKQIDFFGKEKRILHQDDEKQLLKIHDKKKNTASKAPKQCNKANKCSVIKVLHALKSKAACKEFDQHT